MYNDTVKWYLYIVLKFHFQEDIKIVTKEPLTLINIYSAPISILAKIYEFYMEKLIVLPHKLTLYNCIMQTWLYAML